jgi:eukaryotic-like serine/threonine-protein kinase
MVLNPLRVKSLFLAASDLSDLTAREAFLDRECGTDMDLRRRVEALLRANQDMPSVNSQTTSLHLPNDEPKTFHLPLPQAEGIRIEGKYQLLQAIGEGGMGSVWMAEQLEPVKRKVAIKLIKEGMDSKRILSRFDAERQVLALMDHPHIAKVLDGGLTEDRRPYFVMELVKGIPLTQYCDHHKLSIRDRLELFQLICSAVQHAHQKGIIHRDLKPSNILIESHDGKPVPKIIDFGLAKAINDISLTDRSNLTGFGMVMGTPLYMAPEQATFHAVDVDTRADIYALGVILYELLTGTTPIEKKRFTQATIDEIFRAIREEEPPTPSNRLSHFDTGREDFTPRPIEPKKLRKLLKGDLDWIVMKALAKVRDERYQTAMDLASDLSRYLRDEPVLAGPPSTTYRFKKFIKRHRGRVVVAGLLSTTLILGIIGTAWGYFRAESAREAESFSRQQAEIARDKVCQSLDTMTSSVTGDSLSTQKEITLEQKGFLKEVLQHYREATEGKADEESVRIRIAKAAKQVGLIEARLGQKQEAISAFQTAQESYSRLIADFPEVLEHQKQLGLIHLNLGLVYVDLGLGLEAEHHYRQAQQIQQRLVERFPSVLYRGDLATSYHNLGVLFAALGKNRKAEDEHRMGLTLREQLVQEDPNDPVKQLDLTISQSHLGILLAGRGQSPQAEELYHRAIAGQEHLARKYPSVAMFRFQWSLSLNNLAVFLCNQKRMSEVEKQYEKIVAIQKKLVVDFPSVPEYRLYLALSHNNFAGFLHQLQRNPEAIEQHQKALTIRKSLMSEYPEVAEYQKNLALSHNNIAMVLVDLGKYPEAQEHHQSSLAISAKLVSDHPSVAEYRIDLARNCYNFGDRIRQAGQANESLSWYTKAIQLLEPLFKHEPQYQSTQLILCRAYHWRATVYDQLHQFSKAIEDWQQAIELTPPTEQANLRAERASSLLRANRTAEAIEEVNQIIPTWQWNAVQIRSFAVFYSIGSMKIPQKKIEHANRAMELLHQAVQMGFNDASLLANDPNLQALRERDDFKKLIQSLLKPTNRELLPKPQVIN